MSLKKLKEKIRRSDWEIVKSFSYFPTPLHELKFVLLKRKFLRYKMEVEIYEDGVLVDKDEQELNSAIGMGFEKLNELQWLRFADEYWKRYVEEDDDVKEVV